MKKVVLCLLAVPFLLTASLAPKGDEVRAGSRAETKEETIVTEEKSALSLLPPPNHSFAPFSVGTPVKTTHTGVFYYPTKVAALGDQILLQDGSIWDVAPSSRVFTLNWLVTDALVVTQNLTWFSSSKFLIRNQMTNVQVEVNLAAAFQRNELAYSIVQIDFQNSRLCLSDGSVWELNGYKSGIFGKWYVGDTIILGINSSPFWGFLNILIDCETNSFVEARCIQ